MKKHIFYSWLPIAIAITVISVTAYTLVQQDLRQTANDPQIQLAEDASAALSQGLPPDSLFGSAPIDMAKSLSPFAIAYDSTGKVIGSSAVLNNDVPAIPAGVLAYAKSHDDDRLTWQPAPGVRIAAVVESYASASSTGYILVGRSLQEVEARISSIGLIALLGWAIAMALSLVAVAYNMVAVRKEQA